jgi:hypothetical protein
MMALWHTKKDEVYVDFILLQLKKYCNVVPAITVSTRLFPSMKSWTLKSPRVGFLRNPIPRKPGPPPSSWLSPFWDPALDRQTAFQASKGPFP